VTRRTALVLAVALVGVSASPSVAHAAVTFDRAFGLGVITGAAAFENCTAASGCQTGRLFALAGGVGQAADVAVDSQGRIVVADLSFHRIGRFPVAAAGTVSFDRVFGIDVDGSDGATGDFESCIVEPCQTGAASGAAGGMVSPAGVAVDSQGRILVGDQTNHRVDRFTVAADGTVSFDRAFGIDVDPGDGTTGDFENCTSAGGCRAGTPSGAPGGMSSPAGVAVDAQGGILVADQSNNRIDRFVVAANGTVSFDRAFGVGVAAVAGGFQNCNVATGCIAGAASPAAGGMDSPFGVAVDAQGRILVAGRNTNRVDRFTVAGNGIVSFDRAFGIGVATGAAAFENCTSAGGCQAGTAGAAAGGMVFPGGVAVDAQGRILVGDQGNDRVDRFAVAGDGTVSFDRAFGIGVDTGTAVFENCTTASGCQAGTPSGAAGGLNDPVGVTVDARGRILVADFNNVRIDRFSPGPAVTVTNALVPATDAGRFDLRVDAVVVRAAARNGQSGVLQVADGVDVTISERAAAGRLTDYASTIDCGGGPRPGTSLTITDVTANVNCTITNTRKPAGPGGGSPIDTSPPVLSAVSLTKHRFAVERHGGTVFRYTLSEDARVVFTIDRATVGRRVGRRCRKQTRSNRQRRRCTRYARVGRVVKQSSAGASRHPFSGRIGRKSLQPAKYRATLVAIDTAGNRSAAHRVRFRVVNP